MGLVARCVIVALNGTSRVVVRTSQLPCNGLKGSFDVFGRHCQKFFAKTLRRSFIIGMNRDVVGRFMPHQKTADKSFTGRVDEQELVVDQLWRRLWALFGRSLRLGSCGQLTLHSDFACSLR